MTVLKKPGELIPVPCRTGAGEITYYWRYPTAYEAIQVISSLTELGGRERSPLAVYQQMLTCIDAIFGDPADADGDAYRRQVTEQMERVRVVVSATGEERVKAFAALMEGDEALTEIAELLSSARSLPECRKLAKLRADGQVYHAKLGLAVAMHQLAEVAPHPEESPRPRRGLPPPQALVDAIPFEHQAAIGWSYQMSTRLTETEEKNSVSPPPGSKPLDSSATASTPT